MFGMLKKKKQGGGNNDTEAEFKEVGKPEVTDLLSELDQAIESADDQIMEQQDQRRGGCGCWG